MTYTQEEKRSRIRGIVGAASGNLVEWFDFYIYAVFAAYFTQALTAPDMDSTTKSIYVWGVFAASFFMRPIGSWVFGRIADEACKPSWSIKPEDELQTPTKRAST